MRVSIGIEISSGIEISAHISSASIAEKKKQMACGWRNGASMCWRRRRKYLKAKNNQKRRRHGGSIKAAMKKVMKISTSK